MYFYIFRLLQEKLLNPPLQKGKFSKQTRKISSHVKVRTQYLTYTVVANSARKRCKDMRIENYILGGKKHIYNNVEIENHRYPFNLKLTDLEL